MQQDAIDVCVCACEKFPDNKESASKDVKEQMDARYGRGWSVVIGEGISFEISYTIQNIPYRSRLYLFFGDVGVYILSLFMFMYTPKFHTIIPFNKLMLIMVICYTYCHYCALNWSILGFVPET
ncbi:Dynein light chain 4, axonemal [Oopsacas minuta]|uniref:Dynein light chain 4, axonemal n=1 Tax=Oopsacas minuta TaxID=111878 RepID=A0AAV7JCQ0_9METZ|nr:Dynein light chain 4, axonemal [Oopsacas minuta]